MSAETYPVVSFDDTENWPAAMNSLSINQAMLAADLRSSFWPHDLLETFLLPKLDSFEPEELSVASPGYGGNGRVWLPLDKSTAVDLSSLPTLEECSMELSALDDVLAFIDSNPDLLDKALWFDSATIPSGELNSITDSSYSTPDTGGAAPIPNASTSPKSQAESTLDPATPVTEYKALPPVFGAVTFPLCQKRKAGQSDDVIQEKRVKRWHCRKSWHGIYVRLDSAVLDLGHGKQHIRWCRRKGLWTGAPGDSWDGEDFGCYVLAGLPCLSLAVRPAGEGFPVQIFWDEHTRTFSGFDYMSGKALEIATDQIVEMLENPDIGVKI
ncbi:uncharacterized protein PG986_014302 [Apiospora aurea]|uniref:Uncharacterized protein n=1 Tax=Apiospora aurea TaxID=335848 RepID=A0ABR1PTM0_9PEZI